MFKSMQKYFVLSQITFCNDSFGFCNENVTSLYESNANVTDALALIYFWWKNE